MENICTPEIKENTKKLLVSTEREGIDKLIVYLDKSDFFTAPASTKYHSNTEGGLAFHSFHVMGNLVEIARAFPGTKISRTEVIISSLLHDLCKVGSYKVSQRNKKDETTKQWYSVPYYEYVDEESYPHGELSVKRVTDFIPLTEREKEAIRWHMHFTEPKENYAVLSRVLSRNSLALFLGMADLMTANLNEKIYPSY